METASDPASLFERCCLLLEQRDPQAASLLPMLERHPAFAPGWQRLGRTLLAAGHAEAARAALTRALAADTALSDDTQAEIELLRAACLLKLGRPHEAARCAEAAARLRPHSAGAAHRHGLCLREAGDIPGARAAFERAVTRDPADANAWFSLGLARQDLHDHAPAADAFRHALELRPDHRTALNLGVALGDAGDLEAALDAYGLALDLDRGAFARIAQAITSGQSGSLWLDPARLRRTLEDRAAAARRAERPPVMVRSAPER